MGVGTIASMVCSVMYREAIALSIIHLMTLLNGIRKIAISSPFKAISVPYNSLLFFKRAYLINRRLISGNLLD